MAKVIGNSDLLETWASAGPIVQPDQQRIDSGWAAGERPPAEYMNWLQNLYGQKLNHLLRNGVPTWNPQTIYLSGDIVKHNNKLYRALDTNVNEAPPSDSWRVQARDLNDAIENALGQATLKAFRSAAGITGEPHSRVVGCECRNGDGSPTLEISMSAMGLLLIDGDGDAVVHRNPGTIVNNISLGAQPNGFDQGAINNNVWIHFYWIWNPTTATLATISSHTPPPTGPTLPAGYTHWAYACSIWKTEGLEERVWVRGNRVWRTYDNAKRIDMEQETGDHSFSISSWVPPLSRYYEVQAFVHVDGGSASVEWAITYKDANLGTLADWFVEIDEITEFVQMDKTITLPKTDNNTQRYELHLGIGSSLAPATTLRHGCGFFIPSYHVPNGDA